MAKIYFCEEIEDITGLEPENGSIVYALAYQREYVIAPHQNAPDFSQGMKVQPDAKRSVRDSAPWGNPEEKGATDFSRWGSTERRPLYKQTVLFDEHTCNKINSVSLDLAGKWYRLPKSAKMLSFKGVNLGSLPQRQLTYFFMGLLQRLEFAKDMFEGISSPEIFYFKREINTSNTVPNLRFDFRYEISEKILGLMCKRKNIVFTVLSAGKESGNSTKNTFWSAKGKKAMASLMGLILSGLIKGKKFFPLKKKNKDVMLFSGDSSRLGCVIEKLTRDGYSIILASTHIGPRDILRAIILGFDIKKLSHISDLSGDIKFKCQETWDTLREELSKDGLFDYSGFNIWEITDSLFKSLVFNVMPPMVSQIDEIKRFLADNAVKKVVADEDVSLFNKLLVSTAKASGVATIVIGHGITSHPIGFLPLTADKIIVWGNFMKHQLVDWGLEEERIEVLGCPYHDRLSGLSERASRSRVQRRLKLPERKILITYIPYFLSDTCGFRFALPFDIQMERQRRINWVTDTFSGLDEYVLVIKLHPGDTTYNKVRSCIKQKGLEHRIKVIRAFETMSLIKASEAVLMTVSTCALDTLTLDKPMINVHYPESFHIWDLPKYGLMLEAKNGEELRTAVSEIRNDRTVLRDIRKNVERYKEDFLFKTDGQATLRVSEFLKCGWQNN